VRDRTPTFLASHFASHGDLDHGLDALVFGHLSSGAGAGGSMSPQ
jgi:hypothetical protein